MKMFMYSLYGDACQWHFSLPPSIISSLKEFHRAFTEHCKRYFSDEFAFDNCCDEYELHYKLEDVNIERSLPHNMQQPFNDLQDVVFSHQHELQMDNKGTERSLTIFKSDCYEFEELVSLATQRDNQKCIRAVVNDSFEEYVEIGDIYHCNQDIDDLQEDNHSIDAFDIVSNASTDLGCHEDEIVPFENPKDDYQIDISVGDSSGSAANTKGNPQLSVLQTKGNCSRHEEKDDEQKGPDQQSILYVSLTEVEQSTFIIEIIKGSLKQHFIFQLEQRQGEVFYCDFDDPIADYLGSIRSINVQILLSDESGLCHLFKLYFCMLWFPILFGSRSSMILLNQFLIWLHWKFSFT
jgi:hypothetical protein